MKDFFIKEINKHMPLVKPTYLPKCEDPNCDHTYCSKNSDTGEWFKIVPVPYEPSEEELQIALLAEQAAQLNAIRKTLIFFTVLIIIEIISTFIITFA